MIETPRIRQVRDLWSGAVFVSCVICEKIIDRKNGPTEHEVRFFAPAR